MLICSPFARRHLLGETGSGSKASDQLQPCFAQKVGMALIRGYG
jgi:hypothetical protein